MKSSSWLAALSVALVALASNSAEAQSLTLNLNGGSSDLLSSKVIQLIGLLTILSIAPSILIMVTCFTRIAVVISLLRTAIGLQQTPPNAVIASLALFLTFFIMTPTFEQSYEGGLRPLLEQSIGEEEALPAIIKPFHDFMYDNVRRQDLEMFAGMAKLESAQLTKEDAPLHVLIPAFMISELKRAFEIGFLLFLPFVVIDLVICSVLMSMGMMMLPPVMISLPFKLIFFVLVDGWYMLCGSLAKSYGM